MNNQVKNLTFPTYLPGYGKSPSGDGQVNGCAEKKYDVYTTSVAVSII